MAAGTEEQVKRLFLLQPVLETELHEIERTRLNSQLPITDTKEQCYRKTEQMYAALLSFYCLLTPEEAAIVRYHFVEKHPWSLVIAKFEEQQGLMLTKSMRSLQSHQAQAFRKIAAFIDTHREWFDYTWLDEI